MRHRRGRALRRRYGRTAGRTTIRVMARGVLVNTAPGGAQGHLAPGDRVEVGGPAANKNYLVAYRVQRLGEGWTRLGPFATVPVNALEPKKRRSR